MMVSCVILKYLCFMTFFLFSLGGVLTIIPSNYVEVNHLVTLKCKLAPESGFPYYAAFGIGDTDALCTLESVGGNCKPTSTNCETLYNASCPSSFEYSLQVNVSKNLNGVSLRCTSVDLTTYEKIYIKGN